MKASPHSTEPLGLTSILASSLPLTLLTDSAPERYVVEAVFNRRVEAAEVALLLGPQTREFLDRRGHPDVQLTVSDRRLVIAGTNLEELRDGLGRDIAEHLAWVSEQVHARQHREDVRRHEESQRLREHTQAIADLAESITFEPPPRRPDPRSERSQQGDLGRWDSEGGASAVKEPSATGGDLPERSTSQDQL